MTSKNAKIRNTSMSRGRFMRSISLMLHESAPIVPHPAYVHAVEHGMAGTYQGPMSMVGICRTFAAGRNRTKRLKMEACLAVASSVRSAKRMVAQFRAAGHVGAAVAAA